MGIKLEDLLGWMLYVLIDILILVNFVLVIFFFINIVSINISK